MKTGRPQAAPPRPMERMVLTFVFIVMKIPHLGQGQGQVDLISLSDTWAPTGIGSSDHFVIFLPVQSFV